MHRTATVRERTSGGPATGDRQGADKRRPGDRRLSGADKRTHRTATVRERTSAKAVLIA
jgi:hypothetical protein